MPGKQVSVSITSMFICMFDVVWVMTEKCHLPGAHRLEAIYVWLEWSLSGSHKKDACLNQAPPSNCSPRNISKWFSVEIRTCLAQTFPLTPLCTSAGLLLWSSVTALNCPACLPPSGLLPLFDCSSSGLHDRWQTDVINVVWLRQPLALSHYSLYQ